MPKLNKTSDIKKTLEDLGIDPDLEPEQAAAEASRDLGGDVQVEHTLASRLRAVPSVDSDEENEDEEDPDDEGDDEEDEEEEEEEEQPKQKAAPKGFAPFLSSKNRAKKEAEKAKKAKAPAPIPDPEPDNTPAFYAPPPPPAPFKSQKISGSASTSKLGSILSKKLPGAEKVKVYKRVNGQLGHVADYTARDLEGFPDVESFLNRYITPEYGFGEYELKGLDGYGREMNAGQVLLLGPPKKSEGDGAFSLVAQMMEQNQRQTADWMNRMASVQSSSKNDQNPVSMMRDLMGLQEMLGKEAKETKAQAEAVKNAAMAESTNAMTAMMQMFMASMQQQAQQTQQMMMLMMQPKEDPMMKVLLAKLLEDKPSSGGGMMPPPPPPPDPLEGIAKLMAVLLPAIGAGGGGGDDEVKELLKAQIQARESERLGPKDLLAIMQEMKQERGTDDFKRSADNLAMMLNITNQLRSSTEGSPAAGFWDALGALFSNRDFAGSIAQTVRARAEDQQKAQLQAQNQQLALQRQALLIAEHKRRAAEVAAAGSAMLPQTKVEKVVAPPAAPATTPSSPAKRAVTASVAKASAPTPKKEGPLSEIGVSDNVPPLPRLPANAADHLKGIESAHDDAARIEKTVRMLIYFSGFPEWRPFTERLLGAAQAGEKTEMLQLLALFFQRFVDMGMFSMDEAKKTLVAVKTNFSIIYGELSQGEVLEEEKPEGPPDFLEVVDSTFDEEEEEEGDDEEEEAESVEVKNGKGKAAKAASGSILS